MPIEVVCGHRGSNPVPYNWDLNTSSQYTILPPALIEIFLIVFTGAQFWVYTGKKVLGPRSVEKLGLPSSVQKVDGSLQRVKGKVLLFSGENFWR